MKPLLLFSEYCDMENELEKGIFGDGDSFDLGMGDSSCWDTDMLKVKAIFIADPGNVDAITLWLEQCNLQMVEQLMDYFEKDAPIQSLLLERHRMLEKESAAGTKEMKIDLENNGSTVYEILIQEMNRKGYTSDAEFYNYIGMDRRIFAKHRKRDFHIPRENALWFAAGLELNYLEAQEFLKKMGYAFMKNVQRENIISQVMRTRKYKFQEMQEILNYYGEKTFGEVRGEGKVEKNPDK